MRTTDEVLTAAGTTLAELAIAHHKCNYTKLIVHVDDGGEIDDAFVTEDYNEYDRREHGWTMLYHVGTGSCSCNCDACMDGDDPDDWAGRDGDSLSAIDDDIQARIDEITQEARQ